MKTEIKKCGCPAAWIGKGCLLFLVLLLSFSALVSCSNQPTLTQITVEGYTEDFFVGDTFETGSAFAVYAVYSDGSRADVTADATVTTEKGMDMGTAGDYMITVSYKGKKCVYTIYVNDSEMELKELHADVANGKTTYLLGETLTLEGIRLIGIYENTQGRRIEREYTDFSALKTSLSDENGEISGTAFPAFGKYTVTVASGNISASYEVTVNGADLSTVSGAIFAAEYGKRYVNGGNMTITDTLAVSQSSWTQYVFGDNYTCIQEMQDETYTGDPMREYHYSQDTETGKLLSVLLDHGEIVPSNVFVLDVMEGVPIYLWWHENTEYGMEAAIRNMYAVGANDPNHDYTETIDTEKRQYSFSFGYRQKRITGVEDDDYYFENRVEFVLSEEYAIVSASLTQILYTSGFETDTAGHTTVSDVDSFSYKVEIGTVQTIGERTVKNPYSNDNLTMESFDLLYNGKVLQDGDVINGNAGMELTIRIDNILPETASFNVDPVYFSDGIQTPVSTILVATGFTAHTNTTSPNIIRIHLSAGGEWELIVSTAKVTKHIKFSVIGAAPETLTTELYNTAYGSFSKSTNVTGMVGATIYFRATPNQYANDSYKTELTVGSSDDATLVKTEINGMEAWALTAQKAGTYEVLMTSSVAPEVTCKLSFTIVDIPNFEELLNGTYSVTDTEGNVYVLNFQYDATQTAIGGTLEVRYQPVGGKEQTQTFRYSTSESNLALTLEPIAGESLGIALKINAVGKLVLEDRYNVNYIVNP